MRIRRQIEDRLGRAVTIGAVYATLDRLEHKGLVSSTLGESKPVRRGRPRRYFRLEAAGERALAQARDAHARMWQGIELDSKVGKS